MDNKKIKEALANKPEAFPVAIAKELGVSEWEVISQLPDDVMQEVAGSSFDTIMKDVTGWGNITFLVRNASIIAEIKGVVPPGTYGSGYFNFAHGVSPISGHVRADNIAHICFVQKSSMGMESMSIQFFDKQGDSAFKIYLDRSKDRKIIPEQVAAYNKLRAALKG